MKQASAFDPSRRGTPEAAALPVPMIGHAIVEAVAEAEPTYRESQIALTAYYLAEKRGFSPGGEVDDWLAAENSPL